MWVREPSGVCEQSATVLNALAKLGDMQGVCSFTPNFNAKSVIDISIFDFAKRIYDHLGGDRDHVFLLAILLINTVMGRGAWLNSCNLHRYFFSAVMLAFKFLMDDTPIDFFCPLFGVNKDDLEGCEALLFRLLDYKIPLLSEGELGLVATTLRSLYGNAQLAGFGPLAADQRPVPAHIRTCSIGTDGDRKVLTSEEVI